MAKEIEHRDWKSRTFGELCPSDMDWARMGAYLDGEGCISLKPRTSEKVVGIYLSICVVNTDIRLLQWCKDNFGGNFRRSNMATVASGKNHKDAWVWTTSTGRAAWIIYNCLPYFIVKREQADVAIEFQGSMSSRYRGRYKGGSHRFVPPEVMVHRQSLKEKLRVMKARGRPVQEGQDQRIDEVS